MSLLTVQDIFRQDNQGFTLGPVSFTLESFRKIALAGESGSGKSTLLKIISGLVQADSGVVTFENARVKGPAEQLIPGHQHIAYLSQHYELRNHYRVDELLDMARRLSDEKADTIYEICRIQHLLKRKSDQLSGGERQRISLARLLTTAPRLLLLDEPFSNLDPIHKSILKQVLRDVESEMKITTLIASHEPQDTLSWAEEILVLKNGAIVQRSNPEDVYHRPLNEYVGGLFGTYNIIPPQLIARFTMRTDFKQTAEPVFVRPEHLKLSRTQKGVAIAGTVIERRFYGSHFAYDVQISEMMLTAHSPIGPYVAGDRVFVSINR